MTIRARCTIGAVALVCGAVPATAQMPRVRVDFRLQDKEYVQAFREAERRRVEDSATAILARAFSRRLGFLSFSRDPRDSTPRVLVVTLDQKDRGPSAPIGEVGLHVVLRNPPSDSVHIYWALFRPSGSDVGPSIVTVENFLAEFAVKVRQLVDADWNRLVGDVLSGISIADSTVAVLAPPTGWLMPYRPEDLCIDTRTGKLRVDNEQTTDLGVEALEVIASTRAIFRPADPSRFPPELVARFKDRIHAKPVEPATVPTAGTLRVTGVYVLEYHYDAVRCATLTPPTSGLSQ